MLYCPRQKKNIENFKLDLQLFATIKNNEINNCNSIGATGYYAIISLFNESYFKTHLPYKTLFRLFQYLIYSDRVETNNLVQIELDLNDTCTNGKSILEYLRSKDNTGLYIYFYKDQQLSTRINKFDLRPITNQNEVIYSKDIPEEDILDHINPAPVDVISTNIRLSTTTYANTKLVDILGLNSFLDKVKTIFIHRTNESSVKDIADMFGRYYYDGVYGPIPDSQTGMVDLTNYASKYISNYTSVNEIPQENLDYLNSGLVASNMSYMFNMCMFLQSLPELNIDTSKCANMSCMFYNCGTDDSDSSTLFDVDLSNFNTSFAISMKYLFYTFRRLKNLNISGWDTSKVVDMQYMFYDCRKLEHIEGVIDMASCTSYIHMFYGCSRLSGVKIKNPPDDFESTSKLNSSQYEIVS